MPATSVTLSCRRVRAVFVAQVALVASCTDPIGPDVGRQLTSCDVAGGTVQQSSGTATWDRAGSPHRIEGDVTIDGALTIEAGALVCASPDAKLTVTDSLIANGTQADSIRIVPLDASAGWQGLALGKVFGPGRSHVRYARLEGGLIRAGSPLRMENVLVERGGVETGHYSGASLEDVVVRASPGVGIHVPWRSGISLSAVRIEGSAGIGLSIAANLGGPGRLTIDRPIRITGGATNPASVPVSALDELLGDAGAADSLTGNALDTLVVLSQGQHTLPMTITPVLAWSIVGYECVCATLGPLHMEAGSTLHLRLYAPSLGIRDLTIAGSVGARASIIGAPTGGAYPYHALVLAGDSATLRGAHIHNVRVHIMEGTRVAMDDVTASNSSFELAAASTTSLSDVRLHAGQQPGLVLGPGATARDLVVTASAGHGVTVRGAGVQLTSCTIGGNAGHGILAENGDVRVSDCSLLPNGVYTAAAEPGALIDARDNWWGDPSGPDGANAGTVSGTVRYEPYLSAPPASESDAATIEIVGGSVVATSDTIRLEAIVRDAAGNVVPFEAVVWSALDPSTAEVFAGGLVLGAGVGETTITATVNGNAAVRTSVTMRVVPGAPVFDWEQWQLDETAADVWAQDGQVFVVSHGGQVFRFDGSSWSTEQITPDPVYVLEIWGRSPSDIYVLAVDRTVNNAPRSGLYHYDGSAWTKVFVAEGMPVDLAGTADGHLFLALQAGLLHHDGTEWTRIVDQPVHHVSARAADDVFYAAGLNVFRFDRTASHDLGVTGFVELWTAADMLLAIRVGLWLYSGPGDWRQLEGSAGISFDGAAGVNGSDVFAIGDMFALRHYDGSVLRPVWVRGAPAVIDGYEAAVAVDGPDVYILRGRTLLRGTRR